VDDATLASEIDAKLIADPDVAANNVDVDVEQGVVTLSGVVTTDFAREHAEKVAERVDGVRRVINELEVS
jgi:hyperosmotically inducible protein